MLNITRGGSVRRVSEGAFKSFYQGAGWKPVSADSQPPPKAPPASGGDDVELLVLRDKAKALKIPYAAQMGMEKLLAAIAEKEQADAGGESPAGSSGELSDTELLEIPASDMTPEELDRAAAVLGFDYKAAGLDITQLREKLPELLAAR